MKWKYQKKLTCLLWFGWIVQSWTLKLVSVQLNQIINLITHLSLFFVLLFFFFYQSLVWFGWFSNDNSTVNSTNDFNGKKTKLFFWNKIKNQKSLSLFVLWIDWWFFDDFSTNKKRVDLFWFFQPNQPFDTSFSQIKSNQINW